MEQSVNSFADFASSIGVMKPNSIKKDDERAQAKLDLLLDDPAYVLEEKIDGCHYKMLGDRFFSTENVEKTDNYPHLRDFFKSLAMQNIVLDGEINYPGKTAQYCTHVTGAAPGAAKLFQEQNGFIHYTIFDILRTPKANWTLRNTYQERRKTLRYFYDTFVKGKPIEEFIHISTMVMDGKREFLEGLLERGLEGGVLKRLDSQYIMGKKPMWQWMKIKQEEDTDLVVIGFEPAKVDYEGKSIETHAYWKNIGGVDRPVTKFHFYGWIGSIVFGAYVDGVLTRICTASGFPEDIRTDMTNNPDNYIGRVARVTYMERTTAGYPRHPAFKNMHEGKAATECTWEF